MNSAAEQRSTIEPARRGRWWAHCTRQLGAYGMTAVLGVGAIGSLARGCEDDPPTPRERVVQITNERCVENGQPRVRANAKLNEAAQLHSRGRARNDRMSHEGSDGSDPGTRIRRQGYRYSTWGENVAAGYRTANDVMRGWMNSPGQRANILNGRFTDIGIGLATSADGTRYWTMVLARPA